MTKACLEAGPILSVMPCASSSSAYSSPASCGSESSLFGAAVVFVAHLLLGVPIYLTMSDEERELGTGLWMFVGTSFVTLPAGIATAFILEARQKNVG